MNSDELTGGGTVGLEPVVGPYLHCMYCDAADGHWELVMTHAPRYGDKEIWFCCHPCRDAGLPCETFIKPPPGWGYVSGDVQPNAEINPRLRRPDGDSK